MTGDPALVVLAFAVCPVSAFASAARYGIPFRECYPYWAAGAAAGTVYFLVCPLWPTAGGTAASAVLALYLWWRDWWNRKGRRIAKALGGKSRALIDELAGKMRDALRAPGQVPA